MVLGSKSLIVVDIEEGKREFFKWFWWLYRLFYSFHLFEDVEMFHLFGEISTVEFPAKDGFIHLLQFRHGEDFVEEFEANGFEKDISFDSLERHPDNLLMVESERGERVDR